MINGWMRWFRLGVVVGGGDGRMKELRAGGTQGERKAW